MNKKNYKSRVTKRKLQKCTQCRTYTDIAYRYADLLEKDDRVASFKCNVSLDNLEIGDYTSDFLIEYTDGELAVRECVARELLMKPRNLKLLDASLDYWRRRGIKDWGVVIDKAEDAPAE